MVTFVPKLRIQLQRPAKTRRLFYRFLPINDQAARSRRARHRTVTPCAKDLRCRSLRSRMGTDGDVIRIKQPADAAAAFETAWKTHGMEALGELFHEDATFVTGLVTIYSDSTIRNEVIDVVSVTGAAAVVHFWSRLTVGTAHPGGPHAVDTVVLAVVTRHDDAWRIKALENVTVTNPRTGEPVLR